MRAGDIVHAGVYRDSSHLEGEALHLVEGIGVKRFELNLNESVDDYNEDHYKYLCFWGHCREEHGCHDYENLAVHDNDLPEESAGAVTLKEEPVLGFELVDLVTLGLSDHFFCHQVDHTSIPEQHK